MLLVHCCIVQTLTISSNAGLFVSTRICNFGGSQPVIAWMKMNEPFSHQLSSIAVASEPITVVQPYLPQQQQQQQPYYEHQQAQPLQQTPPPAPFSPSAAYPTVARTM
jgi:hypothetical protein